MDEGVIKCPHCAEEIKTEAKTCKHCGKNVREETGTYKFGTFIMAAGLLGLIGGIFIEPVWCGGTAALVLAIGYVIRNRA